MLITGFFLKSTVMIFMAIFDYKDGDFLEKHFLEAELLWKQNDLNCSWSKLNSVCSSSLKISLFDPWPVYLTAPTLKCFIDCEQLNRQSLHVPHYTIYSNRQSFLVLNTYCNGKLSIQNTFMMSVMIFF